MVLTLYVDFMSQPSRSVVLFCLENKIPHKVQIVQIMKNEQKTPQFAAMNPNKKLPTIDDDGFFVYESHSILRYLSSTRNVSDNWYPKDVKLRTVVDMYLDWHHSNVRYGAAGLTFAKFLGPKMGLPAQQLEAKAKEVEPVLKNSLKLMNETLGKRKFLCGDKISIADLLSANELEQLVLIKFDYSGYPHVENWLNSIRQLPNWNEVCKILYKVAGVTPPVAKKPAHAAPAIATSASGKFKSEAVLSVVEQNLINEGADVVKQMGATFCFNISAGDQTRSFFVDLKNGSGAVKEVTGTDQKADTTFTMTDDDFINMATGKLNPQIAFMNGKLRLKGNLGKALQFNTSVLQKRSQQIKEALANVNFNSKL